MLNQFFYRLEEKRCQSADKTHNNTDDESRLVAAGDIIQKTEKEVACPGAQSYTHEKDPQQQSVRLHTENISD